MGSCVEGEKALVVGCHEESGQIRKMKGVTDK